MRFLLAVAATVSLVGCAHIPAPAAVTAVAPAADVDPRPWSCTTEGVCRWVEAPVDPAHVVAPPVPDVSNEGWTVVAASEPSPQEKAAAELTPGQAALLEVAAWTLRGIGGK